MKTSLMSLVFTALVAGTMLSSAALAQDEPAHHEHARHEHHVNHAKHHSHHGKHRAHRKHHGHSGAQ